MQYGYFNQIFFYTYIGKTVLAMHGDLHLVPRYCLQILDAPCISGIIVLY